MADTTKRASISMHGNSTEFYDADEEAAETGDHAVQWDAETKYILNSGQYYVNQNSVFVPGKRIRMNVVPIVVNIVLPWILFTVLLTISTFRFRHEHGHVVSLIWQIITALFFLFALYRIYQEWYDVVPTWTRVVTLSGALMLGLCYLGSHVLYSLYFLDYYEMQDMKVYPALDVVDVKGQDVMDAGKMYFMESTSIDFSRSWHFKHHDTYCVAPLIKRDVKGMPIAPKAGSFDFFAVGKNCCSAVASDFRCGKFEDPHARSGLRILDEGVVPFYRLAVQQAETEFDFIAAHPIFVEWTDDPVSVMENLNAHGLTYYLVFIALYFVFQSALILFFVCVFGFLGRRPEEQDQSTHPALAALMKNYGSNKKNRV